MTPSQATRPELRNRLVHFRIADSYIPDPGRLLAELYNDHLLQGRVREISVYNDQQYLVVDVESIATPVIVSIDRILGVL
jgi:hypothetical protein